MGTLVKVRFRLAWQNYRVGDVIEPPGTLRDWLLASGYAERVEPDPPAPARRAGPPAAPAPQPVPETLPVSETPAPPAPQSVSAKGPKRQRSYQP